MAVNTKFGTAYFSKNHGKGYYVISSSKEGNRGKQLHRLIYEDHYGPIPKGMQIHHIDGDTTNNNIDNLEMISISEHNKRHNKGAKPGKDNWMYGKNHSDETKKKLREQRLGTSEIDEYGGVWFLKEMKKQVGTMKTVAKFIGLDDSTISRYLSNRGLKWSTLIEQTEGDENVRPV